MSLVAEEYRYRHFKRRHLLEGLSFGSAPPDRPMPDFDLPTTAGGRVRKSDFVGRCPLFLIFGSITCPMTASADPDLKRLYAEFGERVAFITLYVREAHPGEQYPQPETPEQKLAHAQAYQERHQIPWPVAVDGLAGDLHRALSVRTPNAVYLMGADGQVAFRALFSNAERAIRTGLAASVSGQVLPSGEHRPRLVPALKGLGLMAEVLGLAGQQARRDVRREVPLLYALARLAAIFRPLPPLGRGGAAMGLGLLGPIAVLAGIGWLVLRRAVCRDRLVSKSS